MDKQQKDSYPLYKDDSRNRWGFGSMFRRDVIYCDHLSMPEEQLLEELNRHISFSS
ncbi:MAG: hypothetical protein IJ580_07355 [Prevotella sp.]|nr:hypothetical protein [Prevotella sp.]MBR1556744.1 hypothetical protein [Prevotella sp.]